MTLRDKILRALYGSAIATGALAAQACADDPPEDKPGWSVNEPGSTSPGNTSVNNTTPANNSKANNTGSVNTFTGPCAEQATGLTEIPYDGWKDEVPKGFHQTNPYIVCADPDVVDCDLDQSDDGEAYRFASRALLSSEDGCAFSLRSDRDKAVCGPLEHSGEACCYIIDLSFFDSCALNVGRPFTVDGDVRFANVARRDGWCEPLVLDGIDNLPQELRVEIARAWSEAGTHEHASIASFARFLMDLMSLGAPKELVESTTRAIDDETRHATSCFSIASAFAGYPLAPEEVDVRGSMEHAGDEAAILRSAIEEGCVGETLAAAQAEWTIDKVRHPEIKEALEAIASDEGDHALLAWQFVDWMLETRPHLIPVAKETFEGMWMTLDAPFASGVSEREREALAHGHLSTPIEHRIRARAFHNVVIPCADAMFANRGSGAMAAWPDPSV